MSAVARYPSESSLRDRVDRAKKDQPNSREFVEAVLAYVQTTWFDPPTTAPLVETALEVCEQNDFRILKARCQIMRARSVYIQTRYEESLPIIGEALPVFVEYDLKKEHGWCRLLLASASQIAGAYDAALEQGFRALEIAREADLTELIGWMNYRIADTYRELGDHEQMLEFAKSCHTTFEDLYAESGWRQHLIGTARGRTQLAMAHEKVGNLEEALDFNQAALERYRECSDPLGITRALTDLGRIHAKRGDLDKGEELLKSGLEERRRLGHKASQTSNLLALGDVYLSRGDTDQAIEALQSALEIATEANVKMRAYQAHEALSRIYEQTGRIDEAFEHYRRFHEIKDEVAGEAMHLRIHNTKVLGEIARAEKDAEVERARNEELSEKNEELARLLAELKSTQAKLVHAEKMASLGQLTAGIAHEIRNPLNFVNNFSELSTEIVEEMSDVLSACSSRLPDKEKAEMQESLETLIFNTGKIREHGARADSIVRSMLQHSRTGEGTPQPVELNKLVDEYLNLAYHGMRARDSSFNATLESEYDQDVGQVECVAQDIGRVLLNLFTNAFDALAEKGEWRKENEKPVVSTESWRRRGEGPTLTVSTSRQDPWVQIRISDNGPGISDQVKSRIFEPFYTTKPTGSGTGLGLSMSFDIITKGHGGELEVISKEGRGATFIVRLPPKQISN